MTPETTTMTPPPPGWRFRLSLALFILSLISPLAIPLVALLNLPLAWKATLSGALLVGVPEALSLLAVALLGKAGFSYLKGKIFGIFK